PWTPARKPRRPTATWSAPTSSPAPTRRCWKCSWAGKVMKILVANLGSTSFKYRLFDMATEHVLARGGVERIGSDRSPCDVEAGPVREEAPVAAPDPAGAVRHCLRQLADPPVRALKDAGELAAIGFKAVHARGLTGVHRVDDSVLSAMEEYADVAPAHNPP